MAHNVYTNPQKLFTTNGIEETVEYVSFYFDGGSPTGTSERLATDQPFSSDFSITQTEIATHPDETPFTFKELINGSKIVITRREGTYVGGGRVQYLDPQGNNLGSYNGSFGDGLAFVFFDNYHALGIVVFTPTKRYSYLTTSAADCAAFLTGAVFTEDPYQTAPESLPDGGYGDFNYKSDAIALPTAPTISVSDSGFVTLYKPSLGQLQSLAAYMWSGLFDIATFRKIFADPMDCIISLALIPVNPTASGSQELKVGNVGTGITIDKLPTQFVEVTFNSLNIGRRANSFMDYSPYTKAQIYLPFIGTRSLSIDDIAGKNVTLK